MNYQRTLDFSEFVRMFNERYVVDDGDGGRVFSLPEDDLLFLMNYLYNGIINSTVAPRNGAGASPGIGESLERFTEQHDVGLGLKVTAPEDDLRALGMLFVSGLAKLLLTADQLSVGLKSAQSKYAGQ